MLLSLLTVVFDVAAEVKNDELNTVLEFATSQVASHKATIQEVESDIAEREKSVASAAERRNREQQEFEQVEADNTRAIEDLHRASLVLRDVQLVQKAVSAALLRCGMDFAADLAKAKAVEESAVEAFQ